MAIYEKILYKSRVKLGKEWNAKIMRGTFKYVKKKNPIAEQLRTSKYKSQTVPDKKEKIKEKDEWKELINYLKSLR